MSRVWITITAVAAISPSARAQPAGPPAPAPAPTPAPAPSPARDTAPAPAPASPAPAPAPAPTPATPTPTTDEDLSEIEKALGEDTASRAAQPQAQPTAPMGGQGGGTSSMNPDIALVLDIAAAWFSTENNLETGEHDPHKTGFNLQQLEMSIGKSVDPYFRFDSNLVFGSEGVEIEEAYATTLALPYNLQVRAGQFLTKFGRINAQHPHAWDFVDQPFAIGRVFGGEGSLGLGAELSYLTPAPFYLELVGSVTDAVGESSARSFFGAVENPVESPLDFVSTLAAKSFFELSQNWSLSAGASVATGPNATGRNNRTDVWGVDLYLKYRPITFGSYTTVALQSEWLYRRRQTRADLHTDVSGYAYLMWRFAKRWGSAVRYELGTGDPDDLDPEWTSIRYRYTGNVTFWPSEFSRLRAQVSVDVPTWQDPIWAAFLQAEFSIGAHGAHAF